VIPRATTLVDNDLVALAAIDDRIDTLLVTWVRITPLIVAGNVLPDLTTHLITDEAVFFVAIKARNITLLVTNVRTTTLSVDDKECLVDTTDLTLAATVFNVRAAYLTADDLIILDSIAYLILATSETPLATTLNADDLVTFVATTPLITEDFLDLESTTSLNCADLVTAVLATVLIGELTDLRVLINDLTTDDLVILVATTSLSWATFVTPRATIRRGLLFVTWVLTSALTGIDLVVNVRTAPLIAVDTVLMVRTTFLTTELFVLLVATTARTFVDPVTVPPDEVALYPVVTTSAPVHPAVLLFGFSHPGFAVVELPALVILHHKSMYNLSPVVNAIAAEPDVLAVNAFVEKVIPWALWVAVSMRV